jgi:hypothetical protein
MRSAVEHCVRVTREIRDARREDPEPADLPPVGHGGRWAPDHRPHRPACPPPPHTGRCALASDVDLLLADTAASVRMNRPLVVFVPPASLAACRRCQEAYEQARKVIEDAGGLTKWMEWVAP